MSADRASLVDAIMTLLKNSTKTQLAAIDDNAIQFGLRGWSEVYATQFRAGIFTGIIQAPNEPLTMSGAKQSLEFIIQITLYRMGYQPETDERTLLKTAEEIEEELYTDSNMRLANADFLGITQFEYGPPTRGRGAAITVHYLMMEVRYRKTTFL